MAITYFRCTNLDENTAKIILYDKDNKINPVEKDVSGEAQIDFNLNELITEEGTYNLYVKAYPATDSTEYLESPDSESIEYIVSSSDDNESGGTTPDEPEEDETVKYTLTIKPSLSDTADTTTIITVTLEADGYEKVTGTGSQSIEVVSGTVVKYTVSASGYTAQTGEYTMGEANITKTVTLTKEIDNTDWEEIDISSNWKTGFVDIEPLEIIEEEYNNYTYQVVDIRNYKKLKIEISNTDINGIGYMTCDANGIWDNYDSKDYSSATSFIIDLTEQTPQSTHLALTTNSELNTKLYNSIT